MDEVNTQQFYIATKSAPPDDRTRVLKYGNMFAVFDRYGDVEHLGLGEEGVLRIARSLGDVDPRKLIEVLLSEVAKRCPDNLCDDDVTVLLMRANGRTKCSTFRDRLGAAIRFIRLLGGSHQSKCGTAAVS